MKKDLLKNLLIQSPVLLFGLLQFSILGLATESWMLLAILAVLFARLYLIAAPVVQTILAVAVNFRSERRKILIPVVIFAVLLIHCGFFAWMHYLTGGWM